ncbi:MAG: hypothetical protein ABR898_00480 [Terracidiphilus sp.]
MRIATLIALIACVLEVLIQLVFLLIDIFHFEIDNLRYLAVGSRMLLIVFTASIAYFFFVFYRTRLSPRPKPKAASGE